MVRGLVASPDNLIVVGALLGRVVTRGRLSMGNVLKVISGLSHRKLPLDDVFSAAAWVGIKRRGPHVRRQQRGRKPPEGCDQNEYGQQV
jgi:hypothetical protein